MIRHLDLSGNLLHGAFPDSISNVSTIQSLNLSYNLLNASIPAALYRVTTLTLVPVTTGRVCNVPHSSYV